MPRLKLKKMPYAPTEQRMLEVLSEGNRSRSTGSRSFCGMRKALPGHGGPVDLHAPPQAAAPGHRHRVHHGGSVPILSHGPPAAPGPDQALPLTALSLTGFRHLRARIQIHVPYAPRAVTSTVAVHGVHRF